MIILSVNGLTKSFLNENILENLTFSISDRDKVGVVGDNGSGKTTLGKGILNIDPFTSGEVFVEGNEKSLTKMSLSLNSQ